MTFSIARSPNTIAHRYSLAALVTRTMELAKGVLWSAPGEPHPPRPHPVRRDAYMEGAAMRREMHRL